MNKRRISICKTEKSASISKKIVGQVKRQVNIPARWLTICLPGILIIGALSGCSLAAGEGDGAQTRDCLIGAAITREEIGKTEAQVTWKDDTMEALAFDGIDACYYIYTTTENADGTLVYGSVGTEGLHRDVHYITQDDTGSIELTINNYVVPDMTEESCTIYMNPIYMTKEKEVYTDTGVPLTVRTESAVAGASVGRSIIETERMNWIDHEIEVSVNVAANLYVEDQPVKITLTEMTEDHKVVKKTDYEPGKVPQMIVAERETEYILVETELAGIFAKNGTELSMCAWDGQTIYQDESDSDGKEEPATLIHTLYAKEDGMLLQNSTWVIWPQQ